MATHSSVLGWRVPWTEEPGGQRPQGCREPDTTEATWRAHTGLHVSGGSSPHLSIREFDNICEDHTSCLVCSWDVELKPECRLSRSS